MKVLFIGAHPDDIELGAGGTLIKHLKKGDDVFYVVFSRGEKGGDPEIREKELKKILKILKIENFHIYNFPDTRIHEHFVEIKDIIEKIINDFKPQRIYTHSLKDSHQDHLAIANATKIAGRRIPQILSYWSPLTYNSFHPEYFTDISKLIKEKIKILKIFKSQNYKDFLKTKLILSINRYYGYLSSVKYAEGFEIIRYKEL